MHCLLGRSALTVDRHAGYRLGQARGQCGGAGDVAGLGADVVQAAEDDVVDGRRIDVVAPPHECLDHMCCHVGWVHAGESALALAYRGADSVDDVCLGHSINLT